MQSPEGIELTSGLDGFLTRIKERSAVAGISAAVSVAGERLFGASGESDRARSWPVLRTSRYGIACLTKLFVAMVANTLEGRGQLNLDVPVGEYLGALRNTDFGQRDISIRHLLSHSGGFQGPLLLNGTHRRFDWDMLAGELGDSLQTFAPGSVFNYENAGHVLVGEVIQLVTGKDIIGLVRETIFDPLGIKPGEPYGDYGSPALYVAPHRIDQGSARTVAPVPFGSFWRASLADITLGLDDMLTLGEAIVGSRNELDCAAIRGALALPCVKVPDTVSGIHREHAPTSFNSICAKYGSGWFGYAGSAMGQTCALRFDIQKKSVCAVAMNAWLPVIRDSILDTLCGSISHPSAGKACGNMGFRPEQLVGKYIGGGNIIRSAAISEAGSSQIVCELGADGLQAQPFHFLMDDQYNLHPARQVLLPGVGFFAEPATGRPCLMVGLSTLRHAM